jgi:hypothetical protein
MSNENGKWMGELERIWKETNVLCFKVMLAFSWTKDNHNKPQQDSR